jgi:pilus assembly protein Flp/PilA
MFQQAMNLLRDFADEESGATAIEYGMIAGGIAVAIIGTVFTVGDTLQQNFYGKILAALQGQP